MEKQELPHAPASRRGRAAWAGEVVGERGFRCREVGSNPLRSLVQIPSTINADVDGRPSTSTLAHTGTTTLPKTATQNEHTKVKMGSPPFDFRDSPNFRLFLRPLGLSPVPGGLTAKIPLAVASTMSAALKGARFTGMGDPNPLASVIAFQMAVRGSLSRLLHWNRRS